jgi:hypothetical protein
MHLIMRPGEGLAEVEILKFDFKCVMCINVYSIFMPDHTLHS